jgi:hypothetical protein
VSAETETAPVHQSRRNPKDDHDASRVTTPPTRNLNANQRFRVTLWVQARRFVPWLDSLGDKRRAECQAQNARKCVQHVNVGVGPVLERRTVTRHDTGGQQPESEDEHHTQLRQQSVSVARATRPRSLDGPIWSYATCVSLRDMGSFCGSCRLTRLRAGTRARSRPDWARRPPMMDR